MSGSSSREHQESERVFIPQITLVPQLFSALLLDADPCAALIIKELLKRVRSSGLLASVDGWRWRGFVYRLLCEPHLSPRVRDSQEKLRALLEVIDANHQLVKRSGKVVHTQEDEHEWLAAAMACANPSLDEIVVSGGSADQSFTKAQLTTLDRALDHPACDEIKRTIVIKYCESSLTPVLRRLLCHARVVEIIDQYLKPFNEDGFHFLELVAELLNDSNNNALLKLHLPVDEKHLRNSDHICNLSEYLAACDNKLSELSKQFTRVLTS